MNNEIRLKRAIDAMTRKPFIDRHSSLFDANKFIYPFCAVLSAVTAFGAFYEFTVYVLSPVLAAIVSCLFLALIEFLEGIVCSQFFSEYYIGKALSRLRIGKISVPRLFFGCILIAFGGLLSVAGAYYSSKRLSTIETGIKDTYSMRMDSVRNWHESHIETLRSDAEQFRSSNMVKDKGRWTLRHNSTFQYNDMQAAVLEAKKQMKEELNNIKTNELKDLFEGNAKTDFNSYAVAFWVFILMVGKQLSHWFRHYYDYRSATESIGKDYFKQAYESIKDSVDVVIDETPKEPIIIEQKTAKKQETPMIEEPKPKPIPEAKKPEPKHQEQAKPKEDFMKDLLAILDTDKAKKREWYAKWADALMDADLIDNPECTKQVLSKRFTKEGRPCSPNQIDVLRKSRRDLVAMFKGEESKADMFLKSFI